LLRLYDGLGYWRKDKGRQGIKTFVEGNWDAFLKPRLESIYSHTHFTDLPPRKILEIGWSEGKLLHELKQRSLDSEFNLPTK